MHMTAVFEAGLFGSVKWMTEARLDVQNVDRTSYPRPTSSKPINETVVTASVRTFCHAEGGVVWKRVQRPVVGFALRYPFNDRMQGRLAGSSPSGIGTTYR